MNFVFFDIECASVYKYTAKICAFGYVLCDEKFNIIKKEDILINPKGKFHLTDGRGERGLVLPYEYSDFKKYPYFTEVYPKIKELLEDKDNLVFGHATLNDVNYLNLETKRFKLPSFTFTYSDSQLMYMTSISDFSRQFGLEYITANLDVEFTPHRAADDAYATMKVVEALAKKHGCSGEELEKLLGIKRGKISDYKVTRPDSIKFSQYRKMKEQQKEERSKRKVLFYNAISRRCKPETDKLKGLTFTFSRLLEDKIDVSIPLVEKIRKSGGVYSDKVSDCTVYVCEEGDESVRTKNARETVDLRIFNLTQLM
ncbi:MAG: exonuclease domain-containing protein, partial [Candidatus Coproplasma sp.]